MKSCNIFKNLLLRIKKGILCFFYRLKQGCYFFLHLPKYFWHTLKNIFKQIHENISIKWVTLFSLILMGSLTTQWYFLSSKKQQYPNTNRLFFPINDMKVYFKKDIELKKMANGKYEVWFQKGKVFHNEQSINRNLPYCEIDFKNTASTPLGQYRVIKSGISNPLDSFGIIKESEGMNFLLVSNEFKSNPKEYFSFQYVDCYIPDKYFENTMKIDIAYVKRVTKGVVVIKKLKRTLASSLKKTEKSSD